jgi:hypothetical protein
MAPHQEPIDLLALAESEGPEVKLPNGRPVRVQLFTPAEYRLWEKVRREQNIDDALELLRRAIPSLTAEEVDSLSVTMIWFIAQAAARKADTLIDALRKNGNRPPTQSDSLPPAAAPSAPRRFSRKTRSPTSSPASGGSKEATGAP